VQKIRSIRENKLGASGEVRQAKAPDVWQAKAPDVWQAKAPDVWQAKAPHMRLKTSIRFFQEKRCALL
jgi:hypothetical protein